MNVGGKYQKTILRIAEALITTMSSVSKTELLERTIEEIPYDKGNNGKPKRDSRPDSAKRALDQLIKDGHLAAEGDMVTLPHFAIML